MWHLIGDPRLADGLFSWLPCKSDEISFQHLILGNPYNETIIKVCVSFQELPQRIGELKIWRVKAFYPALEQPDNIFDNVLDVSQFELFLRSGPATLLCNQFFVGSICLRFFFLCFRFQLKKLWLWWRGRCASEGICNCDDSIANFDFSLFDKFAINNCDKGVLNL